MNDSMLITSFFNQYKYDDVAAYEALGGFEGLKNAIHYGTDTILGALKTADLKGRGGAEYPAWRKWSSAMERDDPRKLILCNADEGEPGSFKDRDILLKDPMKVIEGMLIGAYVIGSKEGYIYIREEYDYIRKRFEAACDACRRAGYLGKGILGTFDFDIHVNTGAGAYICGENSALIESMHGKPGRPRLKNVRVGEKGLFDMPTMVNNVETFVCAATVMIYGVEAYCRTGTPGSVGNKVVSLSGKVKNPGTYEIPFGTPLETLLYDIGGGPRDDLKIKFVQSGGASGPLIPSDFFHLPYTYEDFEANGFSIGAGSIVVVDEHMSLIDYLLAVEEFFEHESCGKCTPCREGTQVLVKILKKLKDKIATTEDINRMKRTMDVMKETSFCGLGVTAPTALYSAFKYFEADLMAHVKGGK